MKKQFGIIGVPCSLCLCLTDCNGTVSVKTKKIQPDYLVLVNKKNPLDADYIKTVELVDVKTVYDENCQMEMATYEAYQALYDALMNQGIEIGVDSSYRSAELQKEVMDEFIEDYGEEYAKNTVALPGYSEHHTGLAVDIDFKVNGEWIVENEGAMRHTDLFSAIHHILPEYGFIVRYPKGKEIITGYPYEPWHLRYVGKEAAKKIADQKLTLEEYLSNQLFL